MSISNTISNFKEIKKNGKPLIEQPTPRYIIAMLMDGSKTLHELIDHATVRHSAIRNNLTTLMKAKIVYSHPTELNKTKKMYNLNRKMINTHVHSFDELLIIDKVNHYFCECGNFQLEKELY